LFIFLHITHDDINIRSDFKKGIFFIDNQHHNPASSYVHVSFTHTDWIQTILCACICEIKHVFVFGQRYIARKGEDNLFFFSFKARAPPQAVQPTHHRSTPATPTTATATRLCSSRRGWGRVGACVFKPLCCWPAARGRHLVWRHTRDSDKGGRVARPGPIVARPTVVARPCYSVGKFTLEWRGHLTVVCSSSVACAAARREE
jgi:hypothetical protein